MAEHIWGPPFSQYSKRKFMPRESRVSQDDAEKFFEIHGVPPPSIMENSLHLLGAGAELPDPTDLQSTILALWKYMVATKEKSYSILKHYYGFLYIRLLIHLTCVTVLRETGALERTPGILRPNSTHKDIFQAVAFLALDIAGKASANPTSLTEFCEIFACPSFLSDKAARGLLSSIIIPELWGERDMFLKLCANGLLPGCSLFFLATHSVLSHEPGITSVNILYLHLQDLGFRLYPAGSHRDREILLPVCMTAIEKLLRWPTDSNRFLHAEDSRTLSQSYSGLLFVWQQDGRSAKTLPIGFIGHLVAFVLHMSGFNPSATPREHIETERTALRFLWLIFEHRGRIPAAEHSYLRYSAVPTFSYLWFIQKCISTQAEQYEFARMLTDVEVIGLAGRILLLIMAEGDEFQNTEGCREFSNEIYGLQETFDKSVAAAPEFFDDSKVEWGKVLVQLGLWSEMGHLSMEKRERDIVRPTLDMVRAWARYGNALGGENYTPQRCAYPRCFQPFTREKTLKVRYMCRRCNLVAYCGQNCQRAHWALGTSESHRLECNSAGQ